MTDAYSDAMPQLQPGETAEIERYGHTFQITAALQAGFHTGRRRYQIDCVTCDVLVHEATTGPDQLIEMHLRAAEERKFDAAYERLAATGVCDAPGGAEFHRVYGEWLAAGRPDVEPFIRERANVGPWQQ